MDVTKTITDHPMATGAVVFVGGLVLLYLLGFFGRSAGATPPATIYVPSTQGEAISSNTGDAFRNLQLQTDTALSLAKLNNDAMAAHDTSAAALATHSSDNALAAILAQISGNATIANIQSDVAHDTLASQNHIVDVTNDTQRASDSYTYMLGGRQIDIRSQELTNQRNNAMEDVQLAHHKVDVDAQLRTAQLTVDATQAAAQNVLDYNRSLWDTQIHAQQINADAGYNMAKLSADANYANTALTVQAQREQADANLKFKQLDTYRANFWDALHSGVVLREYNINATQ